MIFEIIFAAEKNPLLSKIDKKELLKWNNEEVIQGTS